MSDYARKPRRRYCAFCKDKVEYIDYKDAQALRKYMTDRGKIKHALRSIANAPGEVIRPGEWAKAKKLIAEGKDINYEGAVGNNDFDANGDVTGVFSVNLVGDDGKWARDPKLLR